MKIFFVFLLGIFLFPSCDGTPENSNPENTDEQSSIKWEKLMDGTQCSMETASNLVVSGQEQLDELWSKAFSGDMMPEKPTIDFSQKTMIALFLGMVNTGGHSIEMKAISKNGSGNFVIEAEHKSPGKSCVTSQAIEYPYYIAIADGKVSEKAEIKVSTREEECE